VLEWIFRRCDGDGETWETPLGLVPAQGDLNTEGLDIDPAELATVLGTDDDGLRAQLPQVKEHLAIFEDRLPGDIRAQMQALEQRLREPGEE
jgi:phosphoenolpyruvate carboxykinase (GTP)